MLIAIPSPDISLHVKNFLLDYPFMKGIVFSLVLFSRLVFPYIPDRGIIRLAYQLDEKELIAVNFWEKIFSEYHSYQIILHDSQNYTIYEVINVSKLLNDKMTYRQQVAVKRKISKKYKNKYRNLLSQTYRKLKTGSPLSFEEKILVSKFKGISGGPEKFLNASYGRRLRTQQGQKDEIRKAFKRSRNYIKKIEEIFRARKIPWEITRIPVIESMFQSNARSAAGAVGIWQILEPTAKRHLKFVPGYDPRKDPIKATVAAARILRHNYKTIGSWPLTILSYNIGRYGAIRAARATGSFAIRDIVRDHRHRTFGFSARNYFYELIAIINVEKNFEAYYKEHLKL